MLLDAGDLESTLASMKTPSEYVQAGKPQFCHPMGIFCHAMDIFGHVCTYQIYFQLNLVWDNLEL